MGDDDEEEDGFGARKKEEELDPAAKAKKMADQAMKDPMSLVNNVGALKFWQLPSVLKLVKNISVFTILLHLRISTYFILHYYYIVLHHKYLNLVCTRFVKIVR